MNTERKLNAQIYDLKIKISKLKDDCNAKKDDKWILYQQINHAERELNTAEALRSIFTITAENSATEKLDQYSKTTPIINDFALSEKEFLIFPRAFTIGNEWHHVALVVKKARGSLNYLDNGLVMTDLKQLIGTVITSNSLLWASPTSRRYPLYSQLVELGKLRLIKGNVMPFAKPCRLGGQTYGDQTGFGWEFRNGEVVREGKPYGDTTTFLIIGIIVED